MKVTLLSIQRRFFPIWDKKTGQTSEVFGDRTQKKELSPDWSISGQSLELSKSVKRIMLKTTSYEGNLVVDNEPVVGVDGPIVWTKSNRYIFSLVNGELRLKKLDSDIKEKKEKKEKTK